MTEPLRLPSPVGHEARPELLPCKSVTASPGRHGRHRQGAHTSAPRKLLPSSRASACDRRSHRPTPAASAFAGCRPADCSATKTQPPPAQRFRVLPYATLPPPLRQRWVDFAHYSRQTGRVPHAWEGRRGAGKGGERWEMERRSRRRDLSSRECSGLWAPALREFSNSSKKLGGGKGRKGKQGREGQVIYIRSPMS